MIRSIFPVFVALLAALPLSAQGPEDLFLHPSKMQPPPLTFKPPRAKRVELKNGMIVFLLEDHELPLVYLRAVVRTGAYLEPDDKLGLTDVAGPVMRTGGTKSMTGDQLDEELEFMAGSVETWIGEESGGASLNILKKDLDRGLELFADALTRPVFDPRKIELRRNQLIEGIRRRNDQPADITRREWRRLVFAGHPYGRISTIKTVSAVTREDMLEFHKKYFFPNNCILVATGDFEEADLLAKLKKTLTHWEQRPEKIPFAPEIPLRLEASMNLIEKAKLPQTNIRMGHLGVKKSDPDWHALEVMDNILGGNGFVSRMTREVRSNRGLAYSVGTAVTGGRSRGVFLASCQTKAKSTLETLTLMREIIANMSLAPPTPGEMKIAKESILNSFVFQFTSSYGIATQQADLEYLGLPADFLETYKDKVAAVDAARVQEVARKHLHPDKLITLIVGDSKLFEKPISGFEAVKVLPLTDWTKKD